MTEFKPSKSFFTHPYLHYKDEGFRSPPFKCFKNTMFEFRSGNTPKKNINNLNHFLVEDNYGSETETLATTKNLSFQLKDKTKTHKTEKKIMIPSLAQLNADQKPPHAITGTSEYSSSQNIEVQHDYIQLFQEDLLSTDALPPEVTFRTKFKGNDKSDTSQGRSKSPHAISLKKKVSIQFTSKSPKYLQPQESNKLQKTLSTFDFNPKSAEIKELKQELKSLQQQKSRDLELFQNQRLIQNELKQSFITQINTLKQTICSLQLALASRQQQLQEKSNMFLEEINQLIKDRSILQAQLSNTINPSLLHDEKTTVLIQLQERLNWKDTRIRELETQNHHLLSQIDTYLFEIQNLKSRSIKLNPINLASELSVFEEALKYSMEEIARYKQRVESKEEEIERLKQTYGITKGETERTKNELSIEQLKRITEVQTIKTTHEAERVNKNNQIKDLKHEVELLQNKVKALNKEVLEKDNFIMNKIKGEK